MKNDYLWDKTGDDAEIEQLEDLLTGFRYVETDPPDLPAMNIIPVRASWRTRFGWVLAMGTAMAGLALVAIYVQTMRVVQPGVADNRMVSPPSAGKNEAAPNTDEAKVVAPTPSTTAAVSTENRLKPVRTIARTRGRDARGPSVGPSRGPGLMARKQPVEKLTKEELYAYNQVKLALFITGAKLQTVSNVIEKIENKQDVSPNKGR